MTYSNTTGLPSPSDILRPFIDAEWFTEQSRVRGNAVHAACASHLLTGFGMVESQYRGYYESYLRWAEAEQPRPLIVECRLVSTQYGYCGQPDFGGYIKSHAGPGVADFKTASALGKAWPLQIAGYRRLVSDNIGVTTMWGCSVRLKEDGSYPLVKFYESFETDFSLFVGALMLCRHFGQ